MVTYKLYCIVYIISPQNRHISERFGRFDIIFSQLQTTPQKVTYCLSIFKIMLGIFPYYIAYNLPKSGQKWPISCEKWPISKLVDTKFSDFSGQFRALSTPSATFVIGALFKGSWLIWPKVAGVSISQKIPIIKNQSVLIALFFIKYRPFLTSYRTIANTYRSFSSKAWSFGQYNVVNIFCVIFGNNVKGITGFFLLSCYFQFGSRFGSYIMVTSV